MKMLEHKRKAIAGLKRTRTSLSQKASEEKDLLSRDFSVIEDHKSGLKRIQQLAAQAGKGAVAEAKVSRLVRVYSKGDKLVQVNHKGREISFKGLIQGKPLYVKYKPATKLYASSK